MWSWFSTSFGILAVLPFIPFVVIWLSASYLMHDRKKSIKLAMDVTTLFLIAVVAGLYNVIFHSSFGAYGIILFILLAIGLIGSAMHRKRGAIKWARVFRAVWRISFFILSMLYVFLLIIGIIIYVGQI